MTNGFRVKPQSSKKQKINSMENELKNSQTAARITQMMIQQLVNNGRSMSEDVGKLFQLFNELQYKFIALQQLSGVELSKVQDLTTELRLKDFTEASDKEDAEKGFTVVDMVTEDSTVILTSTTSLTPDAGIFRSRIKLTDTQSAELIKGLVGQKVGTKVEAKLNGVDHTVELLGIRQPAPTVEVAAEPLKAVQ